MTNALVSKQARQRVAYDVNVLNSLFYVILIAYMRVTISRPELNAITVVNVFKNLPTK